MPNKYLPDLIAENGESTVRAVLESHFISPTAFTILLRDPFSPADYEAFLADRQQTLQDAIQDLLVKERLDLPRPLRELDAQVEALELRLRALICEVLDNDASRLPSHVSQRIDERVQAALKRNPALDADFYATLGCKLEYADLRELQDTVMGKSLRPLFQRWFPNRELLANRFGQMAELRNGIRHSRTVDEVTRKEGEAAILWFQQVLAT